MTNLVTKQTRFSLFLFFSKVSVQASHVKMAVRALVKTSVGAILPTLVLNVR